MLEREFVSHALRTSQMRHDDQRTAFLKHFLESRDCSPDTGVISNLHLVIQRNVEINSDNGFLAGEIVSVNKLLHINKVLKYHISRAMPVNNLQI